MQDQVASILRNHFQTEGHDAGIRSTDLRGTGSPSGDPEARMTQRMIRRQTVHRHVRRALALLPFHQRAVLELAYGLHLRSRDVEDGRKRKAIPASERDWRVRLRESFPRLGTETGVVLASPYAWAQHANELDGQQRAADAATGGLDERVTTGRPWLVEGAVVAHGDAAVTAERGIIGWLLHAGKAQRERVEVEVRDLLREARRAFAVVYRGPKDEIIEAQPKRSRRVNVERILASRPEHGHTYGP